VLQLALTVEVEVQGLPEAPGQDDAEGNHQHTYLRAAACTGIHTHGSSAGADPSQTYKKAFAALWQQACL
jgi:hypothetical protein